MAELSKEELLEIIANQQERLSKQDERISGLERDFADLQEKYNKLLKEMEAKLHIIKVQNHNRYYSTKESAFTKENKEDISSPINEVEVNLAKKKGRPLGSRNFANIDLEGLAQETVTLDIAAELVNKGWKLTKIGEDVSYLVKVAKEIKVIRVIAPKYIRSGGKEGKVYQAVKDEVFPHSICTASFVSQTMKDKFLLGVPYYRQAEYYYNEGIKLSRQDLCNYQLRATEILEKYYRRLKHHLIDNHAHVICADETTQKLVKEKKTGYVWVYLTSFYDNPIYVYEAALDRKAGNAINFLKDYKGYLLTDAYPGYAKVNNVTNCYCWVHARRNFMDIIKALDNKQKAVSKSQRMVDMIDELLHLERKWRDGLLSPNEIKNKRNSFKT